LALAAWYIQVTIIDLLPKILIGQTWIWKSYTELFKNRAIINQYKSKINSLLEKNDSRTTIFNVVHKLRAFVKNKHYVRFKP